MADADADAGRGGAGRGRYEMRGTCKVPAFVDHDHDHVCVGGTQGSEIYLYYTIVVFPRVFRLTRFPPSQFRFRVIFSRAYTYR